MSVFAVFAIIKVIMSITRTYEDTETSIWGLHIFDPVMNTQKENTNVHASHSCLWNCFLMHSQSTILHQLLSAQIKVYVMTNSTKFKSSIMLRAYYYYFHFHLGKSAHIHKLHKLIIGQ